MAKQIVTVEMAQEFNRVYDNGETMENIGLLFGLTASTISRYIWNPRPIGKVSTVTEDKIKMVKELRYKPCTIKEIKRITGLGETMIYKCLKA